MTPASLGWSTQACSPRVLLAAPSPASSAAAPGSAAASSSEAVSSSASAAVPEMPAEDPDQSVGGASKHEHLMWVCRAKEYGQLSYPTKMHRVTSVSFKKIGLVQATTIGELLLHGLDNGMTEDDIRVWKLDLLQEAAEGDLTVRAHE